MGETTYGINTLKEVIKLIGDIELLTSDAVQGFSLKEIGEALTVFGDLKKVLADKALIVPEFSDLTEDEKAELTQYIKEAAKFPKDVTIELYVQKALEFAVALSGLLKLLVHK